MGTFSVKRTGGDTENFGSNWNCGKEWEFGKKWDLWEEM